MGKRDRLEILWYIVRWGWWKVMIGGIIAGIGIYNDLIPPSYPQFSQVFLRLDWRIWVIIGLSVVIGVVFEGAHRYIKTKEKKQQEGESQERSEILQQLRREIRDPEVRKIPEILQAIHSRMGFLIKQSPKGISKNKARKIGEALLKILKIEVGQFAKLLPIKTEEEMEKLTKKLGFESVWSKKMIDFLLRLGALMDKQGVGVRQITEADSKYQSLIEELEKQRVKVSSLEISQKIQNYVICAYVWNSGLLFNHYISNKIISQAPLELSSMIMLLKQGVDAIMNKLLGEIAQNIEAYLLGEKPK